MSDLDILHEIEKEYGIKFEEISEEEWEKHVNGESKINFFANQFYLENEKIIFISLYNVKNLSSQLWNLVFLSELQISECAIPSLSNDIVKLKYLKKLGIHYNDNPNWNIPTYLGDLDKLEELNIRYTHNKTIPTEIGKLKNLKKLNISSNDNLKILPVEIGDLENLEDLNISETGISYFPIEVATLANIKRLDISHTTEMKIDFSDELGFWNKLEELIMINGDIQDLPENIGKLKNLKILNISSNTNLKDLPEQIGNLEKLEDLDINHTGISTLPKKIGRLKNLKKLNISSNVNLQILPEQIGDLEKLEYLNINQTGISNLPKEIEKLKNLKKLDIGLNQNLEILPVEIGDLRSLEELSISVTSLSILPKEIGKLKKLKVLIISHNENIISIPAEIGGLESLEELDASFTDIQTLPSDIGKLKNLRILNIHSNRNLKALPVEIGDLLLLEELYLRNANILILPNEIGKLKNLRKLDISSNEKLQILPEQIGELAKLEELLIGNTDIESLPTQIGKLKSLLKLIINATRQVVFHNLTNNKKSDSNKNMKRLPEEIGDLHQLEELDISHTGIKILPNKIGQLRNLKNLTISFNEDLNSLPKEIGNLGNLETLALNNNINVSGENIISIISKFANEKIQKLILSGNHRLNIIPTEIVFFSKLSLLDLSDCNISTLTNINWEKIENLQKLNLYNNKISDIEPLKYLKNIQEINLSGNKDLTTIPETLLSIKSLERMQIYYLQNKKLLVEIKNKKQDAIEGAKEYYRKKRETLSQIQKQVKVILIGDGNSGKTSLLRRLLLDGFSDNSATTHGIRLEEDYFEIDNDKVKIKYWDMGGQDVYHSPHSFFFSDNTIYLLVLDARKEEAPEYWMEQIKTYGNSRDKKRKSPVLVVVNKIDAYPSHEIDISKLEENVELIGGQVFEVSAFENKGIKEVEKALHDFIEAQLKDNTRLINKTGEQYKDLTRDIYNLRYDQIFKDRDYLRQEEFNELLTKNKLLSQKDILVKELQELGAILSFPHPKIQNPLYVYKPEWLIDKIYHLFKVAKNEEDGMIDILDLPKILDCKESQEIKFIQSIIEKVFELAFTKSINGESFLFIPDALPYKKDIAANTNRDNTILIQVKFPYLNRRIISNCMIELSKKLFEQKLWKTGMVLKIREEEIIMEALEEERMISFQIPNSIAKDGLVFIQNSLSALDGDNLNFPKTSIYVQVPSSIDTDLPLSKIQCMVDIEDAKFYWNETEEIRNLYFPSLKIEKPIPLDKVLEFYGIKAPDKKKSVASTTIIINANDESFMNSLNDILDNRSDEDDNMNIDRITNSIGEKLKGKYSSDVYEEKLHYWIPEYTKLAAFSVDTLKNAFSLYEIFQKSGTGNYTAAVIQLARAFEQEMEDRIFGDFKKSCNTLHPFSSKEEILLENYSLNINNLISELLPNLKIPSEKDTKEKIGKIRTAVHAQGRPDYTLHCIVYTLACSHLMKDDGNLFVRYFKKFLNEKFHYERIGNNEFAASIIELKELRNKAAHKGTHFNEEQGKLVWKKMTYFFHDWTRALKV